MTGAGRPAGQRAVRLHNLRLVLGELARTPGSKADLAQRTGLTKATVASLVDSLIERGLLVEAEPERSGPGRPARALSFNPAGPVAVAVELNVDYLAIRVTDLNGRVCLDERTPADNRAGDTALSDAAARCRLLLDGLGRRLAGIVLGLPAVVSGDGTVLRAPNLPWLSRREGFRAPPADVGSDLATDSSTGAGSNLAADFARLLSAPAGVPVWVDNEANLAALASVRLSPQHGQNLVYVSAEIGIGAGLVVGGRLFRGVNGFAGELGHVVVHRDGPVCGCGGQGCVEQYAGQNVLLAAAGQADLGGVHDAVAAGDTAASAAVSAAGSALGVGLASLLNVLDLPVVVLGGAYTRLFDQLSAPIRDELERRVPWWRSGGRLLPSTLGLGAAVQGGTRLVIERSLRDPLLLSESAGS